MQLKTLNGEVAKLGARGEAPTRGLVNPEALDHPWLRERLRLFGERWPAAPG